MEEIIILGGETFDTKIRIRFSRISRCVWKSIWINFRTVLSIISTGADNTEIDYQGMLMQKAHQMYQLI